MKQTTFVFLVWSLAAVGFPASNGLALPASAKDWRILLKTGTIITENQARPVLEAEVRLSGAAETDGHFLLQFNEIPSEVEKAELLLKGVRLLQYVPNMGYWARMSPAGRTALNAAPEGGGVRWARASSGIDKLALDAKAGQFPPNSLLENGKVAVRVLVFADVDTGSAEASFTTVGGEVIEWLSAHLASVSIRPDRLADLAALDIVEWVQPSPGPDTDNNEVASQRIHATELRSAPYSLDGTGVTVGIWDGGRVAAHTDFGNRLIWVDTGAAVSDHATHVAGTVGGSGAGAASAMGMAPSVALRSYDWDNDMAEMRTGAGNGVRLSNHSYGQTTGWDLTGWDLNGAVWQDYGSAGFGQYGIEANEWDDVVYDTGLIVFKAAGNDRDDGPDYPNGPRRDGPYDCICENSCGKNIITIGATTDTNGMTTFSSWGPVDDGRVKPDLCANGEGLNSTLPNNQYGEMSGTSMATPSACGAAAMLHQLHTRTIGGNLRADTCKALLVHAATDLGRTGPDYEYGWGLINARSSADLLQNRQYRQGTVAHGATQPYSVTLPADTAVLKATLVWTDPAGTPAAAIALVNNLDLFVTSPAGIVTRPWILDPQPQNRTNAATRGMNGVDNVEQVSVASPVAGAWTISVQGTTVAQDGPQAYTMVCEYLAPSGVYVDKTNTGLEDGTQAHPFNTVIEGVNVVRPSGQVNIVPNTYPEVLDITKPLTLESTGGTVTIGP